MDISSAFSSLDFPCDQALAWSKEQLSKAKLRCMQTFDLRAARHMPENCCCPHHGAKERDCQMVILLVYGNVSSPVTLVFHGNDGQTWISLADSPQQQADTGLITSIRQALVVKEPVSVP